MKSFLIFVFDKPQTYMREEFLHFLWRTRRFDTQNLYTTDGDKINILDFGTYNTNAGPDFLEAQIRINDIVWVGNIEMHVKASDWWVHQHQTNKQYDNVILHVVYDDDVPVKSNDGASLACLVMKKIIPEGIYPKYHALLHTESWIPCAPHWQEVPDIVKKLWLPRILVERLALKTSAIAMRLAENKNDWEETFWHFTARYFGSKVNDAPMEWLAQSIPHLVLAKLKNNLFVLEALLFGQAGFLTDDLKDDYALSLKKEYAFLRIKYSLQPLVVTVFQKSRMRPSGFPETKIALLAALIYKSSHLFSKVLEAKDILELENLFNVSASEYWKTHYVFDKISSTVEKNLGKQTITSLLINVVAPFIFHYGQTRNDDNIKERAIQLLDAIKPEKNNIIEKWEMLQPQIDSAAQTQALIHLKQNYCDNRKCLYCAVGAAILK